jgi:nicotinic acid mononucleotide adenylyltransferase
MSKATFTFGRFNPPTETGHGKLVSAVQKHAEETGGSHYIFPSHTQDAKKNPLSHEHKVGAMKKMFKGANVVSHDKVRTAIDAMKHLESKGHTHVTMVVGSDRVKEFHGLLNKYRKKEYPGIKRVSVVSAGHRDPDAEGEEGESASKHRELVAAGKRKKFISKYSDPKLGAEIHDAVKKGMQMESTQPIGVFLIGGPGSGKDYVLKNIFSRFDLTEVQVDHILNGAAKELIESNQNIIINGSLDEEKIAEVMQLMEGYAFDHVYVSVSNKVSRNRNSLRANPLEENKRLEKWYRAEKLAENLECFIFNNSLNLNESSEFEKVFFASQIEKLLERLINDGLQLNEKANLKTFTIMHEAVKKFIPRIRRSGGITAIEKKRAESKKAMQVEPQLEEKKFAAVPKDKESGLPKKYVSGLSASTAKARKAHWKKMSKFSDKDPKAYEPAPGDATAKTKPSKHTIAVRKMMNNESADSSLAAKAEKSGVSVGTLRKVYKRGVAAWNSGHRPGTTPQQWGHARVNSYINKGKTYHTADKDLREDSNIDVLFERQLEGTDEYRIHAIETTPGQKQDIDNAYVKKKTEDVVDVKPTLKKKRASGLIAPARAGSAIGGASAINMLSVGKMSEQNDKKPLKRFLTPTPQLSAPPGGHPVPAGYEKVKSWGGAYELRKIREKPATVKEAVEYHIENKISFTENVFRPGSDMFFEMISEAKKLYSEGKYATQDEWEIDMLQSDIGEKAIYEGQEVILDYPFEEELNEEDKTDGKGIGKPWRENGGGAVYVRDGGSIRKIRFSQSGMKKKYMDPGATRSFVARHRCLTNKDKTSASYWACRWPRFFSNSGKVWW